MTFSVGTKITTKRSERSKAIEQINKARALAASGNENEADNALRLVDKLMEKYGLTDSELGGEAIEEMSLDQMGGKMSPWRSVLAESIADFFDCRCLVMAKGAERQPDWRRRPNRQLTLILVGRSQILPVAQQSYNYLMDSIEREFRDLKKEAQAQGTQPPKGADFRIGAAWSIKGRLQNRRERQAVALGHNLNEIVQANMARVEDYLGEQYGCMKTAARTRKVVAGDFSEGLEAGKRIGLDSQVSGSAGQHNSQVSGSAGQRKALPGGQP